MRRRISFRSRTAASPDGNAGHAFVPLWAAAPLESSPRVGAPVTEVLVAESPLARGAFCAASANSLVAVLTALVSGPAGGTRLATSFVMNWSIRSSPSFFRNVLVMLMTTASIGISASKVAYASAEARTGQRLRVKLRQTITQKWATFSSFESSVWERSALSSQSDWSSALNLRNLENFFTWVEDKAAKPFLKWILGETPNPKNRNGSEAVKKFEFPTPLQTAPSEGK